MSGFVEKLFDSFGDKHKNEDQSQQQQQSYNNDSYSQSQYGGQPQQSYGQQQPQLPHGWVARWDDREQRYFYINEQTGERSWTPPSQGYGGSYAGSQQGYQQQYGQYGSEQEHEKEKKSGHGNAAMWGVGGAALGLGAGALLMHEGEEMSGFRFIDATAHGIRS